MHFLSLHLVSFRWGRAYQPTGIALAVNTYHHDDVMQVDAVVRGDVDTTTQGCCYGCGASKGIVGGWSSIHIDHLLSLGKFCIANIMCGRGAGMWIETPLLLTAHTAARRRYGCTIGWVAQDCIYAAYTTRFQ